VQLRYRRSGGFAGTTLAADVDGSQLSDADGRLAGQLLTEPAAFRASGAPVPPGAADLTEHRLEVSEGRRSQSFRWTDLDVPDAVRPLLATLRGLAKPV